MTKIRLAFLISTLDTGGAERQLVNTLNGLDSTLFDIKVFVLKNKCEIREQITANIPVEIINIGSYLNPINIYKTIKAIRLFQPQILHSVMYASNLIARFYKIFNRKTIVINHIHGIGSWIKARHIFIDRLLLPYVDKIIVVSEKSKEIRLTREKYPESKVIVIYNSINSNEYIIKNRAYPTSVIRLGTASRLVSLKQIDLGIKIVNQIRKNGLDVEFIIAGSGPENESLQQLVRELNLSENIKFNGHITNMPEFYQTIDCFVLFSRTEDMPLSIVEAFASGLPVIAPNVGGVPELLSGNIALIVDMNQDIMTISNQIIEFFKKCDFEKAHLNNQEFAVRVFDNVEHKIKMETLYLKLLGKNGN